MKSRPALWAVSALLSASAAASEPLSCEVELVVLGAGQDAGAPQIGNAEDDGPRLLPSSLGLIDRASGKRYLFDATPAITEQLAMLDAIEPPHDGLGVDGVFLTHAHIGHYLGLAYFGREAAGANGVPVYAMPRMEEFLRGNGPWSQLVELGNIEIFTPLPSPDWPTSSTESQWHPSETELTERLAALVIPVPHRDEFSETVGWVIFAPGRFSILYLPDLDSWSEFEATSGLSLDLLIARADQIFIDATFWDDNELDGRDMSEIPHPRVTETMDRLQDLPAEQRAKVHFIHYNHTNPIRDPDSAESREVIERGFNVARRGDRHCLAFASGAD
ncbi:MBL fold metallo-hydrolase [uncultured Erythrobacter sp.]|uniref:MBL fold metallo-hydrolase n=1 Tax=uncultured Erythrobacter sp. TaxID=263913 RepID=UPI002604978C|nr:MBL fold metallo-hydrolase [uncultured Erythrobacter sp.]